MGVALFINDHMKKTKYTFQELFEKIDQEDDGEVYLRFYEFSKLYFHCNALIVLETSGRENLCSGKLFSSYGLSTKMSTRMRR